MPIFPRCLASFVVLAVWSPAFAGIDAGGGLSSVGAMNNHGSIGGGFTTLPLPQVIPAPRDPPQALQRNHSGLIEVIYWLTPSSVTDFDPAADSDRDGSSNLMEYLAGTDPANAASMLHPEVTYADGLFRILIPTLFGRFYHVWASRDLKNWTLHRTLDGSGTVKVFEFDETTIDPGPLYSSRHPSKYFFKIQITLSDFDSAADVDKDGSSDLMEYLAGTDPNNSASVFRLQGAYAEGVFRMPIPTLSGRIYRVWVSRDLQNWTLYRTLNGNDASQLFEFDESTILFGPLQSGGDPSKYFFRIQILIP